MFLREETMNIAFAPSDFLAKHLQIRNQKLIKKIIDRGL